MPPEVLEDYLTNGWEKGVDTSKFPPRAKGYKQSPETIRKRLESIANRSDEEKLKTSKLHSESTKKQMSLLSPREKPEMQKDYYTRMINNVGFIKIRLINLYTVLNF